jgi:hypothetical protein
MSRRSTTPSPRQSHTTFQSWPGAHPAKYAPAWLLLAQPVGRLHREHHAKREVIVCDYVDGSVPVLARMAQKRQVGYRSLGYELADEPKVSRRQTP